MSKKRIIGQPVASNPDYREGLKTDAEIQLSWIDRIRVLFGARIFALTEIRTQWRVGEIRYAKTTFEIEKVLAKYASNGEDPVQTIEAVQ